MLLPLYDENPTNSFPVFNFLLIAINVLVFFWEISLGPTALQQVIVDYGFVPKNLTDAIMARRLFDPAYITIFTSMFLHGGFVHVFGNMLYLWIFGNNVEDRFGHIKFFLFYIFAGIAGVVGQTLVDPYSTIPGIGASGAIAGVLGGYLLMFPKARVVTIIPIFFFLQLIKLPAVIVLGFWIFVQFISGVASITSTPQQVGGVAWFAHIGGFAGGILLTLLLPKHKYRRKLPS